MDPWQTVMIVKLAWKFSGSEEPTATLPMGGRVTPAKSGDLPHDDMGDVYTHDPPALDLCVIYPCRKSERGRSIAFRASDAVRELMNWREESQ